jgi:hypothetical protein
MSFALNITPLILIVGIVSSCKPTGGSKLSAVATSRSLKTGFFIPKIQSDMAYGTPKRIGDPMELMNKIGLKYSREPGEYFRVATTAESENILVLFRPERAPAPLASLDSSGKSYFWSSMNVTDEGSGLRFESNLFVKHPIGETPSLKVENGGDKSNIFFTRFPNTEDEGREPMLVNWVDHLLADGSNVLFRVGNLVYLAGPDHPILRFQEIGNQVWVMDGKYKDRDVEKGTVFWTADGKKYFSINPRSDEVVEWRKQDKDSMEVVSRKKDSSVRIPDIVARTIAEKKESGLSLAAEDDPQGYFGMDWGKLSKGTVPLVQHDELLAQQGFKDAKSADGFSLAGEGGIPDENSPDYDDFFEPPGSPKIDRSGQAEGGTFSLQGPQGIAKPYQAPKTTPGIPIFNPRSNNYDARGADDSGNWVQIQHPPGSGNYRVAVVQQEMRSTKKNEGWLWDSEVPQYKHRLQMMEPDGSGGYRATGQFTDITSENNGRSAFKTVSQNFITINGERARYRANADRDAAAATASLERFRYQSGTGAAHMDAAEKNYQSFRENYTLNDNLKWAAGEGIDYAISSANKAASQKDLVFRDPPPRTLSDRFAADAADKLIKGGANQAAGFLIDRAVGPVKESKPFSVQGTTTSLLESTARTLAGSAAKHYLPVKLPDGLSKTAMESARGVLTKWGFNGVKGVTSAGYDYVTKPSPQAQTLTARERGMADGQRQSNLQGAGWMAANGAADVTFAVAKKATEANPLANVAVRVGERGTKVATLGAQTFGGFSSANSAFLNANQALKPWENNYWYNGSEARNAVGRMESSVGRSYRPALPTIVSPSTRSPAVSSPSSNRVMSTPASSPSTTTIRRSP